MGAVGEPTLPPLSGIRVGAARPSYVFLHGLFGQGRNWTSIAKGLEPAGSLLIDLPNHGDSPWTKRFSYDQTADLVADLLQVGGAADDPITLVGHSLGGKVAMRVALRHPELVARLAVIDISPTAGRVGDFSSYTSAMLAIDLASPTDRRAIEDQLREAAPDPRVLGFLMQSLRRRADGQGYEWRPHLRLLGDSLDIIGDWPSTAGLAPFTGPTLWVAGADSDYVRPEHLPAMRALFPRVRLVTVKSAGHWVHADRPEVVIELLSYLGSLPQHSAPQGAGS